MARRSYANFWSHVAARLTQTAHTRAPVFRWGVLILLAVIWVAIGLLVFTKPTPAHHYGFWEALYRTFAAVSMSNDYFDVTDEELNAVRFAALAVPIVGLTFAFSGALGQQLAQTFNLGARNHVVIAGDHPAALSLALDCRKKFHDAVILIGQGLSDESVLNLRRQGVIVVAGDSTNPETLANARAHHASHVVAFEPDDTANLQTEAAVRGLVGKGRRDPPISMHVSTHSPTLLREAREMRSQQMRVHAKNKFTPPIDPKPFSLEELAARTLVQQQAVTLLEVASKLNLDRLHLVFFGFDDGAEAVAERVYSSLWSARFEAPRITVLTQDHQAVEARFRARHREAFAHPDIWAADAAFMDFDWDARSIGPETLDVIESTRGKPCAVVVSTGSDPNNIQLAIALKRVCNYAHRWPVPIFMKETSQSEFSREYAHGDDTAEFDAYLQAFGAHQQISTRAKILDGALDRGAAIAHEHYSKGLADKDPMSMRELQAAMRDWEDVMETYRAANRAVADAAAVKVWDAGWRPAAKGEKGDAPQAPGDMMQAMARREHDRWMAERLMSGWRPTAQNEARSNEMMAHDKLVGWDKLSDDDRNNDVVQIRAAIDIARMMHPSGFVAR
jgi:hypothetical protein